MIHALFQWIASLFGRRPITDQAPSPVEGDPKALDLLNRAYGTVEFTEWEEGWPEQIPYRDD